MQPKKRGRFASRRKLLLSHGQLHHPSYPSLLYSHMLSINFFFCYFFILTSTSCRQSHSTFFNLLDHVPFFNCIFPFNIYYIFTLISICLDPFILYSLLVSSLQRVFVSFLSVLFFNNAKCDLCSDSLLPYSLARA